MENKIKYTINGNTKYYTENELREYYMNLLKKGSIYDEHIFESKFEKLLKTLREHEGDPYGDIIDGTTRKHMHDVEEAGGLLTFPWRRPM